MAESMRGMRLGTQSLESDRGVSLAERQTGEFRCTNGHEFPVVFSLEAELPQTWDCTACNAVAVRIENGKEIEKQVEFFTWEKLDFVEPIKKLFNL